MNDVSGSRNPVADTAATSEPDPNQVLWNDVPAPDWLSAFPVGNGRIGGMVFGRTSEERIALNHERLWRGVTQYRTIPDVAGIRTWCCSTIAGRQQRRSRRAGLS